MDMLSEMLDLNGFKVRDIDAKDTELHLYLDSESETGVCPRCRQSSRQVRQWYRRVVRDLPISGKACYLHVGKRYFECRQCQATFPEPLDFAEPKRDDTTRYETSIFQQVRHTTATYVAEREGLTDKVVTRICVRQAKQRIPDAPFEGVVRLGIDEIAERKGRQSYDLILYNLDTGKPLDVLENRTQAELMRYLDTLPAQITRQIEEVCIDMWRPYATAIAEKLPHAKLVTDRFRMMKAVNQDLNTLKKTLKKDVPDEAKACHYPLLKNEDDLDRASTGDS